MRWPGGALLAPVLAQRTRRPMSDGPTRLPPTDPAPPDAEVTDDQLSLVGSLRQPRTLVPTVLPLTLLVLFRRALPGYTPEALQGCVTARANPQLHGYLGALLGGLAPP